MKKNYSNLRFLVDSYFSTQKMRCISDNRVRNLKRDWGLSKKVCELYQQNTGEKFIMIEKWLKSQIEQELDPYPIWHWMKQIRGISVCSGGGLIAWIKDIKNFETISKLYAYAGMASGYYKLQCEKGHKYISAGIMPKCTSLVGGGKKGKICGAKMKIEEKVENEAIRKVKGYKINWNPKLKTHCWKIGKNFVKSGRSYRQIYDTKKEFYQNKYPEYSKLRIDRMAMRSAVKLFLSHFFVKWCELEGIEYRSPYVFEKLGHSQSSYISPDSMVEIDQAKIKKSNINYQNN